MASSIPRAAKEKTVSMRPSAILEGEPALKKCKAQMNLETAESASKSSDIAFTALTTEVSYTVPNMDFAEAPNNVEIPSPRGSDAVDNESFPIPELNKRAFDRCIEELEKANIFVDPATRNKLAKSFLITPEKREFIKSLTTVEFCSYMEEYVFKILVLIFICQRRFSALEEDFEKAKATISDRNAEISALKEELALNSNKLAKAEAKLKENNCQLSSTVESLEAELKWKESELSQAYLRSKVESQEAELKRKEYELSQARLSSRVESLEAELKGKESELSQAHLSSKVESLEAELKQKESELSQAHLSSRVEYLEAELKTKQVENEVLKSLLVASEQKASSAKQKILSLEKKIFDVEQKLSTTAAEGFKEKSQNPEANLLLYLASSNPT